MYTLDPTAGNSAKFNSGIMSTFCVVVCSLVFTLANPMSFKVPFNLREQTKVAESHICLVSRKHLSLVEYCKKVQHSHYTPWRHLRGEEV
jgi:hypothetical protein